MGRFTVLILVLAAALVGPLAALRAATLAQEATPAGDTGMPPGVTFDALAFGLAETLPPGPVGLGLFRSTLAPGTRIDLGGNVEYYLIYAESGAITFRVDTPARVVRPVAGVAGTQALGPAAPMEDAAAGADVTLRQGDAALFAPSPGGAGEARNDGQETAVVLIVLAGPPMAAPADATPVP
jgi:hypothetical protein